MVLVVAGEEEEELLRGEGDAGAQGLGRGWVFSVPCCVLEPPVLSARDQLNAIKESFIFL